jgi:hypothetical protein
VEYLKKFYNFINEINVNKSHDSWALGWTIGILALIPSGGWEFFSSPLCPEWLWNALSLISNGYQGLFQSG